MLIAPWHFSFTVSDIEQSILFYRDVLGMELMHRQEQANEYTRRFVGYPDAHLKVAQFRIAGLPTARSGHVLELVEYVAPRGQKVDTQTKNTGTAHLAFQVDDPAGRRDGEEPARSPQQPDDAPLDGVGVLDLVHQNCLSRADGAAMSATLAQPGIDGRLFNKEIFNRGGRYRPEYPSHDRVSGGYEICETHFFQQFANDQDLLG